VITGCAGFIGSFLTERLLDEGWTITGIDSLAPTYNTLSRRDLVGSLTRRVGFEFVEGDLNNMDLSPFVGESDVVFHLAARPGVRASWRDFAQVSQANILATQHVLDSLAEHPSSRLVFASSSSVYGNVEGGPAVEEQPLAPISPYGVSKASCEALMSAYTTQFGIVTTSLRYFTVFGPRQRSDMAFTRWIRAALRGEPLLIFGDGSAERDFTYVADVVDATARAATISEPGHHIYNVAGGSPATVAEVVEMIRRLVGRDVEVRHVDRAPGDPNRTSGDTSKIRDELGWAATRSLEEGLTAQVNWWLERSAIDG
jgi:nucleoside-diphosphate-sugar epimerase